MGLGALLYRLLVVACLQATWRASAVLRYGHAYQEPGDYSQAQFEEIARSFPIHTVEKRHAVGVYGTPGAAAPFLYNTWKSTVETSKQLKALNSSIKVLLYWNAALHYDMYECEDAVQSEWLMDPSPYTIGQGTYNYDNVAFRDWWVQCAIDSITDSNGFIDGIFIDAMPKVDSRLSAAAPGLLEDMMDAIKTAHPETLIVYNGFFSNAAGTRLLGGENYLQHADAVFVESVSRLYPRMNTIDASVTYLQSVATAAETYSDKLVIGHGEGSDYLYGLSCFLMISPDPDNNYFLHNEGYDIDLGMMDNHAEYAFSFGLPLGAFTRNGAVLTREFEHYIVTVNLEVQSGSIDPQPTPAPSAAPTAAPTPAPTPAPSAAPSASTTTYYSASYAFTALIGTVLLLVHV